MPPEEMELGYVIDLAIDNSGFMNKLLKNIDDALESQDITLKVKDRKDLEKIITDRERAEDALETLIEIIDVYGIDDWDMPPKVWNPKEYFQLVKPPGRRPR